MKRLVEFFESDSGALSMSRLLMFGSFLVTSIIMLHLQHRGTMNEGYFYGYITAWSGTYLAGKGMDVRAQNNQIKSSSEVGKE